MKSITQPQRILDLRSLMNDLLEDKILSQDDVDRLLVLPRGKVDTAKHPIVYLSEQQLENRKEAGKTLDLDYLGHWLANRSGLPYFDIDPLRVKASLVTQIMSFAYAKQHKILAVNIADNKVVVACSQPYMTGWVANLEHVLNRPIERVLASPLDIERYTTEFYTLAKSISGANADSNLAVRSGNIEAMMELGELKDPEANDQHVVTVVDWLFQYAFEQRASDIHIEPRREMGNVRFRIDGVLHRVYEMPAQVILAVISRIKNMGRLNIAEKRKPQDGRLKTKTPDGMETELRLSTMPTAFGEKMVMRIFDPEVLLKNFSQLGLANQDYDRWNKMTSRPDGIVLVTGPTGSGKTTTLYSTLKHLATPEVNVCTIEDPIEMVEESFNQMQVHHGIQLSFAEGVRSLLRQDPDIIMVGEIRDQETAEMAVQAALTGHLVLSTLHTNDAPSAVTRLLEIGLPAYLLKATLLGVMAQRLVRTLCPACKAPAEVNIELWNELVSPWKADPPEKVFKPVGCLECRNTGFKGRQGIYEVLVMSPKVQKFITEGCDLAAMRKEGMKEGMRTLRLSGAQKVAAGLTTMEEVMRVAPVPHNQ
jgi:general secretion pathway protein E